MSNHTRNKDIGAPGNGGKFASQGNSTPENGTLPPGQEEIRKAGAELENWNTLLSLAVQNSECASAQYISLHARRHYPEAERIGVQTEDYGGGSQATRIVVLDSDGATLTEIEVDYPDDVEPSQTRFTSDERFAISDAAQALGSKASNSWWFERFEGETVGDLDTFDIDLALNWEARHK